MSSREALIKESEDCPAPLLDEVLDFLRFLKAIVEHQSYDSLMLSYDALARDWLTAEEDEAWKDLQ